MRPILFFVIAIALVSGVDSWKHDARPMPVCNDIFSEIVTASGNFVAAGLKRINDDQFAVFMMSGGQEYLSDSFANTEYTSQIFVVSAKEVLSYLVLKIVSIVRIVLRWSKKMGSNVLVILLKGNGLFACLISKQFAIWLVCIEGPAVRMNAIYCNKFTGQMSASTFITSILIIVSTIVSAKARIYTRFSFGTLINLKSKICQPLVSINSQSPWPTDRPYRGLPRCHDHRCMFKPIQKFSTHTEADDDSISNKKD
uniref:Uncharacterized protein n=1 Tax=Ditylenchus dipsaci TaxID=166011 RepID=A0A915DEB8_9BILA